MAARQYRVWAIMPGSDTWGPVSGWFRVRLAAEAWAAQLASEDWTVYDENPDDAEPAPGVS